MNLAHLLRRLIGSLVAIFASSVIIFSIFFILPGGDPAKRLAGRAATPETIQEIRESYGFDRPLYQQYASTMKKFFTDDLISYTNHTHVVSEIFGRIEPTVSVAVGATLLGSLLTVLSALVGAVWRGRAPAFAVSAISMIVISTPGIYLIAQLRTWVSVEHRLLPLGGYTSLTDGPADWLYHLLLPWFVLSLAIFAVSGRLLTSNLVDAMQAPYVKTARAKGVPWLRIWVRHVLPNAVLPVVTTLGLELAGLLGGGTILVETIFDIHGIGQYAAQAVQTLDLPILIGVGLVGSTVVIVVNAAVDVTYPLIDPRAGVRDDG